MKYTKEFKDRDELLRQLEADGLAISDRPAALNFLTRVGYFRTGAYRTGAYRYVFRQLLPSNRVDERLRQYRTDRYLPGSTIEHVMQLEAFGSRLSRVCVAGLLDFEIRLRSALTHTLAARNVAAQSITRGRDLLLNRSRCARQSFGESLGGSMGLLEAQSSDAAFADIMLGPFRSVIHGNPHLGNRLLSRHEITWIGGVVPYLTAQILQLSERCRGQSEEKEMSGGA